MKLHELINSLSNDIDFTEEELIETIKILISESVCGDRNILFKIGKIVKEAIDYEES